MEIGTSGCSATMCSLRTCSIGATAKNRPLTNQKRKGMASNSASHLCILPATRDGADILLPLYTPATPLRGLAHSALMGQRLQWPIASCSAVHVEAGVGEGSGFGAASSLG